MKSEGYRGIPVDITNRILRDEVDTHTPPTEFTGIKTMARACVPALSTVLIIFQEIHTTPVATGLSQ